MAEQAFKVSARIPGDKYRIAERLLHKPENAHVQTMSDVLRWGLDLAIIEMARNVPDPEWQKVAALVEKKRELERKRMLKKWEYEVSHEEILVKSYGEEGD